MKKLFLLLALLGMVAVGCSKDDTDKGNDNKTEQPNENEGGSEDNIPENIFFGLDKESVTISPDGGSVDVIVYSNYKWEISGTSDWCTPSVKGGDANEDGQKVTFSADTAAYDDREATFWFRCADKQIKFVVSQKFKETIIPDANNSFNIPAEGGIAVISYQTSVDCDVIIPEEAQDWITIAPATRGLVSESITLDIAENTTYSSRSAVIKVVAKDNAELAVEYTINQEQNDALLVDENNTFTVPSTGGEVVINYQTNLDCEVIIPDNAQSWITIAPATRGLVAQSATLHIVENTTYSSRTATIKVIAKNNAELVIEYTINQVQNDAVIADENNVFTVPSAGGEVVIQYQTNVDCEVIIPEEAQDWITIAPATRGLSTYSTTLNVAENTTYSARTAVIKVVAKDNAELVVEYTINQEQNDAVLANGNTEFTIDGKEQQITIKHKANVDCDVIIPEDAQDWITIAPATRGLISENINLDIAENTTYSARTAVVKVVARDNAELAVEYTINQEQIDAVLANGNTEFIIDGKEQQITIEHKANVDCEVIIPDEAQDWVAIAPATRGLSTYSTTLNIAENNSGKERSCVIKVTSQGDNELSAEYTITQKPRYCLYYTSNDGKIVQPYKSSAFGVTILSNTYIDGVGAIDFDTPITTIGKYAFYNCDSLTSVTIPDSVTTIGEDAFRYCSSLTSVYISDISAWCNISFSGSYSNPLSNGCNLYLNNELVTDLTIPDSVTTIGNYAFRDCDSLTSVTIPDSVTTIGIYAFAYCSSLTSVTIPDSVTTIGDRAFDGCTSLTSITIPDSVTTIGKYTFYNCSSLTSVDIPDSVTTIGDTAFTLCSSLTSVTIPDSVTTIGDSAFGWCSLTSVTIGDSVTTIGNSAFRDCYDLTSVTIPDSVTTIGGSAFLYCSSLTSVTIGESVTTIGSSAFEYCSSLTSVYCKPTTPPAGDSYMFSDNASGRMIYVPKESVNKYKSASGWLKYRSYIVGYDF